MRTESLRAARRYPQVNPATPVARRATNPPRRRSPARDDVRLDWMAGEQVPCRSPRQQGHEFSGCQFVGIQHGNLRGAPGPHGMRIAGTNCRGRGRRRDGGTSHRAPGGPAVRAGRRRRPRPGKGERDRVTMLPTSALVELAGTSVPSASSTGAISPRARAGSNCRARRTGSSLRPGGSRSILRFWSAPPVRPASAPPRVPEHRWSSTGTSRGP